MKNVLFGGALLFFAGYRYFRGDLLETILYAAVGLGFLAMDLQKIPALSHYSKFIKAVSWVLIIGGVLLFIAVLRRDAYGW